MKKTATTRKIPQKLQSVLWSTDVKLLDKDRDKNYIIHQILSYGILDEIRWLLETYTKKDIIHVFANVPYKDYDAARFYFVKNHLLNLKQQLLDEMLYVKNIPRHLG